MQIAIFKNIRAVIRAERLCQENDIAVSVVPLPEHLSSECGMCLKIDGDTKHFEKLMQQFSINIVNYEKI